MVDSLKAVAKVLIATFGQHRWPTNKSSLVILAYHRVLPTNDPRYKLEQPMMVVTPQTLEKNLRWAAQHFQFISLNRWLTLCKNGVPPKGKHCAITFDDGWLDNKQYALDILKKYNTPATIFCVSGMIDNKNNYWPGRVTTLIHHLSQSTDDKTLLNKPDLAWLSKACSKLADINWSNPDTKDYSNIIESLKIYDDLQIHEYINSTKSALKLSYDDSREILTSAELKPMIEDGLIEIGSHTVNHIRFSEETTNGTLSYEIISSKEQLTDKLHTEINTFCYPNGFHPLNSVNITSTHYNGACTLEKGWNYADSNFAILRRVSLHERVASNYYHFKARLSGWI